MPAATTHLTRAHYETLASFRQALRRFLSFSAAAAHAVGIPPQQHQALLAIKGAKNGSPITIRELAERLDIRHHSAVGLVDRLTKRKWVKRRPSREDRRRVEVGLTARGEALIQRLSAVHVQELHELGPTLRRLLDLLERTE